MSGSTAPGVKARRAARKASRSRAAAAAGSGSPVTAEITATPSAPASTTAGTFETLGAPLLLGRDFTPEEDREGGPPVVILGYGIWQNRYGGDPDVLGRTIELGLFDDGVFHRLDLVAALDLDLFLVALVDLGDADDMLIVRDAEYGDALRVPAHHPDVGDGRADHLALVGDEHQLLSLARGE